jgi:hypothetical protein
MTDVSADEELRAEVERLRKENAKLARRASWGARARSGGSAFLLVLGCGLAVLSLVAIWLKVTLLDTDRYVSTVAPIAASPAVQDAVAKKIDNAIFTRVDFASLARQVLPDRADVLAPAIQRGAQSVISDRVTEFTRSQRFQDLWVQANQRAHARVVELLTGGRSKRLVLDEDTVYLDLSPAVERVKSGLQERGLTRIADAIPPSVDGQVKLFQSSALVDAQRGVKLLKGLAIVLPILAALCLLGSVFASRSRRRGLLRVAVGLALAMILLIAALAIARSAYLSALSSDALPTNAASDIFDTVVAFLRHGVRVVVIAAVVLGVITFLVGLPLQRYATSAWAAFMTSTRRQWVSRQRNRLMIGVGALGLFALLVWNPLTGGVVLIVAIVVALLEGAIYAIAEPGRESPVLGDAAPPPRPAA